MALKKCVFFRSFLRKSQHTNIISIIPSQYKHNNYGDNTNPQAYKHKKIIGAVLFGSVLVGSNLKEQLKREPETETETTSSLLKSTKAEAGTKRLDLPTFTAEEVSRHNSPESFWVTYKHGVYDVTSFLPSHPGGNQILNAGGYSVEPFWNVYGMHKTEEVFKLLESYRIGNLNDADVVDNSGDELWAREPVRDRQLTVQTQKPFNAESPSVVLINNFDTPSDKFYVRQHMPVPELDPKTHKITITIKGDKKTTTKSYCLKELQKFQEITIRAALMCAGNRRSEMKKAVDKEVKGISWSGGAIGNAVWTGVLLRDILLDCGLDVNDLEGKHVILQGADIDATGTHFSTSIPLQQAVNGSPVLLAYRMNGAELLPDHGRPVRAVVPGAPAVRSVKWIESITVSRDESPSHWHLRDYRSFNSSTSWETADFDRAPPVYSLPVTSYICEPEDGTSVKVHNGLVEVKGYAFSGGGARIVRVDVSPDGGRTWVEAEITRQDSAPAGRHYAWTHWKIALPVQHRQKQLDLWVKATDSNFNTQPENFDHIWNIRGILSNAYHKIKVQLMT